MRLEIWLRDHARWVNLILLAGSRVPTLTTISKGLEGNKQESRQDRILSEKLAASFSKAEGVVRLMAPGNTSLF